MVAVRSLLTRGYARLTCGGVCETEKYTSRGIDEQVYWVETDGWMSGQYTPFGTILLNKYRFRERSDDLNEYVFLHEIGHSRMPMVPSVLLGIIRILAAPFLLAVPLLPIVYIPMVQAAPVTQFPELGIAFLLSGLTLLLPYVVASWIDEGYAEYFALSTVGVEEYLRCHKELHESRECGLLKRIWIRLTYPHPRLVHWVASRLQS